MVDARGWEEGKMSCFVGKEFQFGSMKKVTEINGSHDSTHNSVDALMPLNGTLKSG